MSPSQQPYPQTVAVVAESADSRHALEEALGDLGKLASFDSVADALNDLGRLRPRIALVDLDTESGDGLDIPRLTVASGYAVAEVVFVLSSDERTETKLQAFDAGADEFVGKPFEPDVLRAQIRHVLSRLGPREQPVHTRGRLRFAPNQLRAWRLASNRWEPLDLTPSEYRLLDYVVSRRGEPTPRDELMAALWPGTRVTARTLNTHVSNLRGKLGPLRDCFAMVRGSGYRWVESPSEPTR